MAIVYLARVLNSESILWIAERQSIATRIRSLNDLWAPTWTAPWVALRG